MESPFVAKAIGQTSEDCLFLDLFVPASAFDGHGGIRQGLPVIVWFHGGGFLFGAKDSQENGLPLYQGDGILQAAADTDGEVIFVVGNYRLGSFGWLAGTTMEKEGVPNAGFTDQRLLLQWVQDFIHLAGGDRNRVSAWGQSAGASSIIFHLIAEGGKRDPLFRKAVALSPGFEWQFDRAEDGLMEGLFRNYTVLVGCSGKGVECLRQADEALLLEKSHDLFQLIKCTGRYSIGPAVDGRLIHDLPSIAFAKGENWKDVESLIISHVTDEASNFVPKYIDHEGDLEHWLHDFLPRDSATAAREEIANRYDAGTYGDERNRATAILRDAFFTCNTRHLYNAYNKKTPRYVMQYNFLQRYGVAIHGSDLLPLFWNRQLDIRKFIDKQLSSLPGFVANWLAQYFDKFAQRYQRYMISHALYGNPNAGRDEGTPEWKVPNDQDALENVMETSFSFFGHYFNAQSVDKINAASVCDFWTDIAINVSAGVPDVQRGYLLIQNDNSRMEL
ncbi:MAG: hypothetical protein MMC23_006672 [Stictis urceolatum]|nr:hypothetical protein [Stictis urceolata]